MKLHTLGPKSTDSYKAVMYLREMYLDMEETEVVLHSSLDDIYQHLHEEQGDLFLVPVAYRSAQSNGNWADNNLKYSGQLKIISVFKLPIMPLMLIRNPDEKNGKAIIHPSTKELIKEYSLEKGRKLSLEFVDSKAEALHKFQSNTYEFSIVSKDIYEKDCSDRHDEIISEFRPTMIWCLYRIANQD
ncbi:hypothetical protein [Lentilactobacillus sp. SPB1-3]|uniref:Uncharacterized protein n=1 Tax=Lentilactobacillus terminaliae TaxID=3003483 RepID=A0ACD5DEC8_9LACO|nr:hypothetical protein [Lentilactobacillus sp. SPB1-3]MCZ0976249.1 hypothetical protein [Lentilactobacillus sp. SPB1-3]